MVRGKCEFYSNRWIGGHFAISLRAEAAMNKFKISRTFFDDMPQNIRNDNLAKWLKRKTMKRWKLTSFYHLSADNVSVDYLIVQARCPLRSVSPKYIEETIKRTLEEPWYIYDKNKRIPLKMFMNEGNSYVIRNVDISDKLDESTTEIINIDIKNYHSEFALINKDDILYKVSEGLWEPLVNEILITNLFFCDQVDLLPEEYEDNGISIFFKVTNTSLYDFRRVNSITEIPKSYFELYGMFQVPVPQIIRVCLREFGSTTNNGHSNYMFEMKMYFICSVVNVRIMIVLILKL